MLSAWPPLAKPQLPCLHHLLAWKSWNSWQPSPPLDAMIMLLQSQGKASNALLWLYYPIIIRSGFKLGQWIWSARHGINILGCLIWGTLSGQPSTQSYGITLNKLNASRLSWLAVSLQSAKVLSSVPLASEIIKSRKKGLQWKLQSYDPSNCFNILICFLLWNQNTVCYLILLSCSSH